MQAAGARRIAYAGVATALSSVCIILTNFLPLRISLLMLSAVCYYIAFSKSGILYGFLTIGASILISFFTKPFSSAFFLNILIFAPYSVLAFFIKKLYYTSVKTLLIRAAIIIAFSSLAFFAVFAIVKFLSQSYIDFAILDFTSQYGYILINVLICIMFLIFDFIFNQLCIRLTKLIK